MGSDVAAPTATEVATKDHLSRLGEVDGLPAGVSRGRSSSLTPITRLEGVGARRRLSISGATPLAGLTTGLRQLSRNLAERRAGVETGPGLRRAPGFENTPSTASILRVRNVGDEVQMGRSMYDVDGQVEV